MSALRKHWRTIADSHTAVCGKWMEHADFVLANVEAVTCGNCLRSTAVQQVQRENREAARASRR